MTGATAGLGAGPPPLPAGVVCVLAVVALAVAAFAIVPWAPLPPKWVVFSLFAGLFPTHLRSIVLLRRVGVKATDLAQSLQPRPRRMFVFVEVLCFAVIVLGVTIPPGQPERAPGNYYYFDDHGTQIQTDAATFRQDAGWNEAAFAAGAALFYVVGIAASLAAGAPQTDEHRPAP